MKILRVGFFVFSMILVTVVLGMFARVAYDMGTPTSLSWSKVFVFVVVIYIGICMCGVVQEIDGYDEDGDDDDDE